MVWRRVWITKRKLQECTGYYVGWYDVDGRRRAESVGTDRKRAEAIRRQRELELNTGKLRQHTSITLKAFADEHLALSTGQVAESTLAVERSVLTPFIVFCEDRKLDTITPRLAESFIAKRRSEVSPATANKTLRTLKAIFSKAVTRGYLEENPFAGLKCAREPQRVHRILSGEEIVMLLRSVPTAQWRAFIAMAVTTGMRRDEMLYLEWDDVDFDRQQVLVRCKDERRTKSCKNRIVPLVPEVAGMLHQLPQDGQMRWVFPNAKGNPRSGTWSRTFRKIVRRSGIEPCTIHDLRRTFNTHLLVGGVDGTFRKELMGHSSVEIADEFYTGLKPEWVRDAATKLPYLINLQSYWRQLGDLSSISDLKGNATQVVTQTRVAS